jgi:5'-nucleotidase
MQQRSGAGRSRVVFSDAIRQETVLVNGLEVQAFALDVTPAQAVYHGVSVLAPRRPSLIMGGINYGENLGTGITGSGTVGVALEGAAWGIPSLAVSLETGPEYFFSNSPEVDFQAAMYVGAELARRVLALGLPGGVDALKVDLPKGATRQTPWRLTRQSRKRHFYRPVDGHSEATGKSSPVFERILDPYETEPGSDIWVLFVERQISVCPLTIDLTAPVTASAMDSLLQQAIGGETA